MPRPGGPAAESGTAFPLVRALRLSQVVQGGTKWHRQKHRLTRSYITAVPLRGPVPLPGACESFLRGEEGPYVVSLE